jgi:hypothetical protein
MQALSWCGGLELVEAQDAPPCGLGAGARHRRGRFEDFALISKTASSRRRAMKPISCWSSGRERPMRERATVGEASVGHASCGGGEQGPRRRGCPRALLLRAHHVERRF